MMKTMMPPHESSFSFSRRHFQKIIEKVVNREHYGGEEEAEEHLTSSDANADDGHHHGKIKKKATDDVSSSSSLISKLKSAIVGRPNPVRRRSQVSGTLFGRRLGHVRLAFQPDPKSAPALLIELPIPTATLVREMASGLVRIALECDGRAAAAAAASKKKKSRRLQLVEEAQWRAYCNGRKCGFAAGRECGAEEAAVLKAVEAVTMGAGVLPAHGSGAHGLGHDDDLGLGEMMYMRARFERVVGSRDSEAYYMMNPDGNYSGPELSLYLLRV